MIVMNLNGGLGNQLFQYALGRHLSITHNTPLGFDISSVEADPNRHYRLDSFNISGTVMAIKKTSAGKRFNETSLINKFISDTNLLYRFFNQELTVIRENGFEFQANILKCPNNSFLEGYWQTEKYFKSIESIIRADLTLVNPLTPNLANLEDEITKSTSISIHVRRGDYASNPVTTAYHGLYAIDWYQMAIKEMEKSLGRQVHFFVFSDDYDWVKTNLKLDMPCTFIKPSPDGMEAQDLYLMSRCKHNITANSSYSWWAAWLNPNPNKKVIAPAKWFMGADSNTIDLIPPEWIKI